MRKLLIRKIYKLTEGWSLREASMREKTYSSRAQVRTVIFDNSDDRSNEFKETDQERY